MIDLTKIDQPIGDLDDALAGALLLAWWRGELLQYMTSEGGWKNRPKMPEYMVDPRMAYRLAPPPLTKPSIDWSAIKPDWKWLARDESGKAYLYRKEPEMLDVAWYYSSDDYSFATGANHLSSCDLGTCDWKDSLVMRPEGV